MISRQQRQNAESVINTRQDRNIVITDGGEFSWNMAGGELTWAADLKVRVGGLGTHTIVAGSISGLDAAGDAAAVVLDRDLPGAVVVAALALDAPALSTDTALLLGVRGEDGRFYLRGGTVLDDGAEQLLGTITSEISRCDMAAAGRAAGVIYALGSMAGVLGDSGVGTVSGTNYEVPGSTFDLIPNTGGVPDEPLYLELWNVANAVFQVIEIVDAENLTLISAPGDGADFHRLLVDMVPYKVGSKQLKIEVDGIGQRESVHYDEVGASGDTSLTISFRAGYEPVAPAYITGINLAGAQGPQGIYSVETLQESYAAGRLIETLGAALGVTLTGPTLASVVLELGKTGGVTDAIKALADGTLEVGKLRIKDASSPADFWTLYSSGTELVLENDDSGLVVSIDKLLGLGFDGGVKLRWAEYTGVLSAVGPTVVATGLTNIVGVIARAHTAAPIGWITEFGTDYDADRALVTKVNLVTGDVTLQGDWAGSAVGADFRMQGYSLLVLYGA